jgi:hypothetical protein
LNNAALKKRKKYVLLRSCKAVYLVEEKYCTAARQLEVAFRLVENRPDVIDAYSRRAKFPKNCVRTFSD